MIANLTIRRCLCDIVDPAPADGQTVDAEQVEKSILTGWLKPGGVKEHATISHPKYGEKQVQPIVEGPGKKAVSAPLVLHGRDNINGEIPVDRMGEVVTFRPENDEFKIDFNYDRAREIFAKHGAVQPDYEIGRASCRERV